MENEHKAARGSYKRNVDIKYIATRRHPDRNDRLVLREKTEGKRSKIRNTWRLLKSAAVTHAQIGAALVENINLA